MTQWDGPTRLRASDAEREQIATILRAAVTEGRLSLAAGDDRLARVYAAVFRDELRPLTADLPDGGRQALFNTPEFVAGVRRRLRLHGLGVVAIAGVLIGIWVLSGAHFFWPLLPLLFLSLGLLRHWRFSRGFGGLGGFAPGGRGFGGLGGFAPGGRGFGGLGGFGSEGRSCPGRE